MRRFVLILAAVLPMTHAFAADTLRVGSQVLVVGDGAARAIQLLGEPVFKEPVQNTFGAAEGERWRYATGERIVIVTIRGGYITSIEDHLR